MTETMQKTRFIPPNRWNDYHPWPPIGGLRHLIFNSKTNGFDAVIKLVGRSIFLDEAEFEKYVSRSGAKP